MEKAENLPKLMEEVVNALQCLEKERKATQDEITANRGTAHPNKYSGKQIQHTVKNKLKSNREATGLPVAFL